MSKKYRLLPLTLSIVGVLWGSSTALAWECGQGGRDPKVPGWTILVGKQDYDGGGPQLPFDFDDNWVRYKTGVVSNDPSDVDLHHPDDGDTVCIDTVNYGYGSDRDPNRPMPPGYYPRTPQNYPNYLAYSANSNYTPYFNAVYFSADTGGMNAGFTGYSFDLSGRELRTKALSALATNPATAYTHYISNGNINLVNTQGDEKSHVTVDTASRIVFFDTNMVNPSNSFAFSGDISMGSANTSDPDYGVTILAAHCPNSGDQGVAQSYFITGTNRRALLECGDGIPGPISLGDRTTLLLQGAQTLAHHAGFNVNSDSIQTGARSQLYILSPGQATDIDRSMRLGQAIANNESNEGTLANVGTGLLSFKQPILCPGVCTFSNNAQASMVFDGTLGVASPMNVVGTGDVKINSFWWSGDPNTVASEQASRVVFLAEGSLTMGANISYPVSLTPATNSSQAPVIQLSDGVSLNLQQTDPIVSLNFQTANPYTASANINFSSSKNMPPDNTLKLVNTRVHLTGALNLAADNALQIGQEADTSGNGGATTIPTMVWLSPSQLTGFSGSASEPISVRGSSSYHSTLGISPLPNNQIYPTISLHDGNLIGFGKIAALGVSSGANLQIYPGYTAINGQGNITADSTQWVPSNQPLEITSVVPKFNEILPQGSATLHFGFDNSVGSNKLVYSGGGSQRIFNLGEQKVSLQLHVHGNLPFTPQAGAKFTLIELTNPMALINGEFQNAPNNSVITVQGFQFLIRYYDGTDNNDVTATVMALPTDIIFKNGFGPNGGS